jgi:putative membrane protein
VALRRDEDRRYYHGGMRRFLVRLVINAVALWLTTLIVLGVHVHSYADGVLATIATYLLVALVFGIVNGVIGNLVRIVAFPLYILTLGLLALIVNALLLLLVAWLSSLAGFGLVVDNFWSGFWGALVLAIISWLIGIILRPLLGPARSRR